MQRIDESRSSILLKRIILMCVVVKYEDGVIFTSVVWSYVYSDRFADVAHRVLVILVSQ